MASFLRLHPTDNVVVAVNGLSPGDIVDDVKIQGIVVGVIRTY